jgi:4a-hydroxytetrahydrobiopterin dehydratase
MNSLKDWTYIESEKCLMKEFHFKSYLKNIAFVNAIAFIANKQNHHPDLLIKYNLCQVKITTHDEGKVTEKDILLAQAIDNL